MNKTEFLKEKQHLDAVMHAIAGWIACAQSAADATRDVGIELQQWMHDSILGRANIGDYLAQGEVATVLDELKRLGARVRFNSRMAARLAHIAVSPYFARIDFVEEGYADTEEIRVGRGAIVDARTRDLLVFDWRAPICSLYYDAEPGPVSFHAPKGEIGGTLKRKVICRIENSELVFAEDSAQAITDETLIEALSQSASPHLRQVVATIQRGQYQAIRDDACDLMQVTGPAGCGKTTVALHRVAFLLYHRRESLRASDVRILSPSDTFSEAISRVLPDLGEEDVQTQTFSSIVQARLGLPVQPSFIGMDNAIRFGDTPDARRDAAFAEKIAAAAERIRADGPRFEDVFAQKTMIMSANEMRKLYREEYTVLPPVMRLGRIRLVASKRLAPQHRAMVNTLQKQMSTSIHTDLVPAMAKTEASERLAEAYMALHRSTTFDLPAVYDEILRDNGLSADTARTRSIAADDAAGMLYLALLLGDASPEPRVRHVVVDEAQDLSATQLVALKTLYPTATFTLLGDPRQTLANANPQDFQSVALALKSKKPKHVMLTHTYRSSRPIAELCALLDPTGVRADLVDRGGEPPALHDTASFTARDAVALARSLRKGRIKSVAIVTRTLQDASVVAPLAPDAIRLDEQFLPEEGGIMVVPVALAKGLEFDAAVVYWPDGRWTTHERRLMYTACSRALHELAFAAPREVLEALGHGG